MKKRKLYRKRKKVIAEQKAKKPKKEITRVIEKQFYNKPTDEVIAVKKKKELEWESFSRKAVDRKFKKMKVLTDSIQQGQ